MDEKTKFGHTETYLVKNVRIRSRGNKGNCKSLRAKTTSPSNLQGALGALPSAYTKYFDLTKVNSRAHESYPVQISISRVWHVVVYHNVDTLNVNAPAN